MDPFVFSAVCRSVRYRTQGLSTRHIEECHRTLELGAAEEAAALGAQANKDMVVIDMTSQRYSVGKRVGSSPYDMCPLCP